MPNWLTRFKNLLSKPTNQQTNNTDERIQRFLPIIEGDVANDIEAARDLVQPADIEPLIALYWRLDNWQQKRALVDIMQDQYHPDMHKMMLDFLRVPVAPGDEWVELAQAVALGFIDEKYDRFMNYYNDRKLLARDVKEVLRKNGMNADPLPPTNQQTNKPAPKPITPKVDPTKSPNQRLMDAATAGELTAVKTALSDGADINVVIGGGNYDGCSALMMALMRKRFDVATPLSRGSSVGGLFYITCF